MQTLLETSSCTSRPKRRTLFGQCIMDLLLMSLLGMPATFIVLVGSIMKSALTLAVIEDRWRFEALPETDAALANWAAKQKGLKNFQAVRLDQNQLRIHYGRPAALGVAHPNWDSMGYRGARLVSVPQASAAPPIGTLPASATALLALISAFSIGGAALMRMNSERQKGVALIGLAARPAAGWVRWMGLAFAAVAAINIGYSWLLKHTRQGQGFEDPLQQIFSQVSGWPLYVLIGYAVLAAPIAEELLYRGCMMGRFQARGYAIAGAVVSAMLFAISHGVLPLVPAYFMIGILLAFLYRQFRSLWPSIALHSLNNACFVGVLLFAHKP
jgi:membrane protease YdiL (CAAX protease family)